MGIRKYLPDFPSNKLNLEKSKVLQNFFGKDGKKQINYHDYQLLMNELENLLVKEDFKSLKSESGEVPTSKLSSHLIARAKEGRIPNHFLENIHRLQKEAGLKTISFEQYKTLHNFIKHTAKIETFIKNNYKDSLSRSEFHKAIKEEASLELSENELNWVYYLFENPETKKIDSHSFSILRENLQADSPDTPKMKFYQSLLLGGVSAMIGVSCVFPLDKVKTRVQSNVDKPNQGIIKEFKNIIQNEGASKLYRGLQAELIGITPEKAVKITVNDYLRKKMIARNQQETGNSKIELSTTEEIIAGMGCGIVQVFISNPVSVVKIRLQMQNSKEKIESPISILRKLGFRGMYIGLGASILRDVPFSMIYFSSYQGMKSFFRKKHLEKNESVELTAMELLVSSCIAGSLAGAIDTPADGIKTRLQNGENKYSGIIDCFTKVYANEGIKGLFRGVTARVLIISPFFGITMLCYEMLQRFLFPHKRIGLDILDEDFNTIRRSKLHNINTQLQLRYEL